MMNAEHPKLSVVIPVYQAKDCLHPLHERLTRSLNSLQKSYEIILVDDRSQDGSWEIVHALAQRDVHVKGVRLSRNFGQHAALTAGLGLASGQWVVVMDCDLQDAPEEIEKLYRKAEEGYDIVYASVTKEDPSWWRRLMSWFYHSLIQCLTGCEDGLSTGCFSVLSRKAVQAFLQYKEAHRHYLILIRCLGFRTARVPVSRYPRPHGESSYSFSKLFRLGVDGLIAQSDMLLRWSIHIGILSAVASFAFLGRIVYYKISRPGLPIGWSSLMATLLLLGGLILISLGILGVYINRIFYQIKDRPLFIIDETINI